MGEQQESREPVHDDTHWSCSRAAGELASLEVQLSEAWHELSAARERFLIHVRADFLVSPSEQRIMWSLLPGPMSLRELVDATGLGKGTISTSARSLVERGILDRSDDEVGTSRYRLTPHATERIIRLHDRLLKFARDLARDHERAEETMRIHLALATIYDEASGDLQRRPTLDARTDGLWRGDARLVESLLQESIGTTGELDDAYRLIDEAGERILRGMDAPEPSSLVVERAIGVARRALDHVQLITRPSRSNGLFAGCIRSPDHQQFCTHVAMQVLEREGFTVLPIALADSGTDLQQYVDEVGLRLLVVAASNARIVDVAQRTIDMILATEFQRRPRVAIVGPMRELCVRGAWGDQVLIADSVDLRHLAVELAGDAEAS